MLEVQIIGIPWYTPNGYAACREIMADKDLLPANYHQWRKQADRLIREIERSGKAIARAEIDPEQFPIWCKARGLNIDAQARMAFANEAAGRAARH